LQQLVYLFHNLVIPDSSFGRRICCRNCGFSWFIHLRDASAKAGI